MWRCPTPVYAVTVGTMSKTSLITFAAFALAMMVLAARYGVYIAW